MDRWVRLLGIPSGSSKDGGLWKGGQKGSWVGARGKSLLSKPGPKLIPRLADVLTSLPYPRGLLGTWDRVLRV